MSRSGSRRAGGATLARCAVALALGLCLPLARGQVLMPLRRAVLDNDPAVAGAQAQLRAAEERVNQAQAGFVPSASLALNQADTRYNEAPAFELRRFSSQQATLQITQPVVRTALLPALESAQAQFEQAAAVLEQARADSTVRFLEACFEVLKARDALTLIDAQRFAAQEQLASAQRSFKVGTATVIDVREAEAKIDTVAAQALAAQAEFDLRQQLLAELVGRAAPELLDRGLTGERMPELAPAGVLDWIAGAQLRNPQVLGAQRALAAAEAEMRKAWQGHAPTLDLSYTFTRNSDTGTVTSVTGRRGDSSQVGFTANIPLFAGGATQSKVREAQALRDKAQSDLDSVRRNVQIGVRQNFSAALAAVSVARGLETATRSLETAWRASRRGYEVGLKVNAEVLEAQTKVYESRRDLSRSRYDAWLNFLKLKLSDGQPGDADIDALDRLLVPLAPTPARGRETPLRPHEPPAGATL